MTASGLATKIIYFSKGKRSRLLLLTYSSVEHTMPHTSCYHQATQAIYSQTVVRRFPYVRQSTWVVA